MTLKTPLRALLAALLFGLSLGAKAPETALLAQPPKAEPAMSLTASDGTGLELRELKVSTVMEGFSAFTEVEMAFFNPEPRQREGRFQMLLPSRASLSRFAMLVNGQWQEGEVVETQKARQAYEDFLHRRQDPALLEQDSGNRFSARVFPIPPQGEKRLILSYSELLEGGLAGYRFPLLGLPRLGKLDLRAMYRAGAGEAAQEVTASHGGQIASWKVFEMKEKDFVPERDFSLALKPASREAQALRAGRLAAIKFFPVGENDVQGSTQGQTRLVLVDSSASQARGFSAKADRLAAVLEMLAAKARPENMRVAAFDQEARELGLLDAQGRNPELWGRLKSRLALGASNFEAAFASLKPGSFQRLLIVSDGAATAGETKPGALKELLRRLGPARVDCLSLGSYKDLKSLEQLSQAGGLTGKVLDGQMTDGAIADRLAKPTAPDFEVQVPYATWVWPRAFKGLQSGDTATVFAELPENQSFQVAFLGKGLQPKVEKAEPLLLRREWTKARLEKLLWEEENAKDADMKNGLHHEIVRISQAERVLCPYTSLLVLETEADYQRFDIERNALQDILAVGAEGIEVRQRRLAVLPAPTATPQAITLQKSLLPARRSLQLRALEGPAESAASAGAGLAPAAPADAMEEGFLGGAVSAAGNALSAFQIARGAEAPASPAPAAREGRPAPRPAPAASEPERARRQVARESPDETRSDADPEKAGQAPWEGPYAEVKALLKSGRAEAARDKSVAWYLSTPEDALALIALGESFQALNMEGEAARAYGSLIDHFPSRCDIRRWAAGRLLALKSQTALAIDSLEKAREQRPDHASSVVLLATAYAQAGQADKALAALTDAMQRQYSERYREIGRILKDSAALILSTKQGAKLLDDPAVEKHGLEPAPGPRLAFLLTWETDANDVDFHIYDAKGGHAFYSQMRLASGGELYADVTQGYGPEFFSVPNPSAGPYRLKAHYYSRGPMGYGMGLLQVLKLSKEGELGLEARPFVIMRDGAYVDLGRVR